MRTRTVILSMLTAGAVALALVSAQTVRAGKPKAVFDVSFGPAQLVAGGRAALVLTLRNSGNATASLGVGDVVELSFGRGDAVGDLLADGATITTDVVRPVTSSLDVQSIASGYQVFATGPVDVPAGDAVVLVVRGVAGIPGAGAAVVSTRISKKAAKAPRSTTFVTVKAPSTGEEQFFGDGAAGAFVASQGAELQPLTGYTDVLIPDGVTVTVASGATIRCTGAFENRGTILVGPGGRGGGTLYDNPAQSPTFDLSKQLQPPVRPWEKGDALAAAGQPAVMDSQAVTGAPGGVGLGDAIYALPLSHYRSGGGGGSGGLGAVGGDGGGLLRVMARGPVHNGGSIIAKGAAPSVVRDVAAGAGAGGGAGGVVILASATSVDNAVPTNANGNGRGGTIDVRGANGGTPDYAGGGGGGGGGGLVVFVAPLVRDLELTGPQGTVALDPGINASGTILGSAWPAQIGPPSIVSGGGGGGACVGNGGDGTGVQANGDIGPPPDPAVPGRGQTIERRADPRTLWN